MKGGSAGYSGTPLVRKLGITGATVVWAIGRPDGYEDLVSPLPDGARIVTRAPARLEFVHLFTMRRTDLERRLAELRRRLHDDGTLWISWPKKSSGVATDVTEDVIRDVAFPLGFVDVKVCAVDDVWSGLKLVVRKELRRPSRTT
jgi:hypothetical protein